jgi:hypothetical protein
MQKVCHRDLGREKTVRDDTQSGVRNGRFCPSPRTLNCPRRRPNRSGTSRSRAPVRSLFRARHLVGFQADWMAESLGKYPKERLPILAFRYHHMELGKRPRRWIRFDSQSLAVPIWRGDFGPKRPGSHCNCIASALPSGSDERWERDGRWEMGCVDRR